MSGWAEGDRAAEEAKLQQAFMRVKYAPGFPSWPAVSGARAWAGGLRACCCHLRPAGSPCLESLHRNGRDRVGLIPRRRRSEGGRAACSGGRRRRTTGGPATWCRTCAPGSRTFRDGNRFRSRALEGPRRWAIWWIATRSSSIPYELPVDPRSARPFAMAGGRLPSARLRVKVVRGGRAQRPRATIKVRSW